MLTLLLSLHVAAAPVSPPAPPRRYRIVTRTTSEVDLSAMGQGMQSFTMISAAFVTISLSDTAGGQLAHVVIDSSTFDGGAAAAQLPPEMMADPKGAVFHLYVVNGKVRSPLTPTPASVQAGQAATGIELLLIATRQMKAGDSWVDTMHIDSTVSQGAATGSRIANWTAKDSAEGLMQLDAPWTGTTTLNMGTMQMVLQTTGANHVTAAHGGDVRQASSLGSGQGNMNLGGTDVPMKVTTEVTATPLP